LASDRVKHGANERAMRLGITTPRPRFRFTAKPGHQQGAIAVELAIIIPLLMLFFVGAFDYARLTQWAMVVANASRAGAQYGAQSQSKAADVAGINARVQAEAQEIGGVDPVTAASTSLFCRCAETRLTNCNQACNSAGGRSYFVEVTATKLFVPSIPYPGLPASVQLSTGTEFRIR